ncbi:TonB-dependent receptor [Thalassomonas actiniarum]|uniref:TonB-dependent receptor n=1 Tax=Thalassomonas actiniarum TaxID=485447 RepID=A0AAF0C4B7_9GAMM|nr:TonB-dependent receptor [Thalassomonas actiniarum]WDD99773.1 TonB-dependent receptor [Thalassomonas actiniarum]
MNINKSYIAVLVSSFLSVSTFNAVAEDIERVEIFAERMSSDLESISRQVTVIDNEVLTTEFASAQNLAEVLAKVVPGMAPPTPALTNFGTTIRGRNALVLIDGVPLNTNRNISRDLHNIHPSQVARVEVFRGGNAIYGSGATGGVIYIHTKSGEGENKLVSSISTQISLTERTSDSMTSQIYQEVSGSYQQWSYLLAGSFEKTAGAYDADGDRIAPEPSQGDSIDSDIFSINGKIKYQWQDQSLEFSALSYQLEQDTDYASDPSAKELPYLSKAQSIKGLELDKQNEISNQVFDLSYKNRINDDHRLTAQLYYRDYESRFSPFDGRPYGTWNHLAQTYLESTNLGLRLTVNSSLSEQLDLDWGLDSSEEKSEMPVTTYDGDIYDESNGLVFQELGDKAFVPELTHSSRAAFAQARYQLNDAISLEAGLRYEEIEASFDDFTTLGQAVDIQGSDYDYDSFVSNFAATYQVNDDHTVYLAANEGYELPDIGLRIRYANEQFDLSQSKLKPVETQDYEFGWRGNFEQVAMSLALFHSSSDLGNVKSENMGLSLSRNKVEIKGIEVTLDLDINDYLALDLSYSYAEGKEKAEGADEYIKMNGFAIPPNKLSAALVYDNLQGWTSQLRLLAVSGEDYRIDGNNAFGRRDVESYRVVDWSNQVELPKGTLTVGIENLFNKQYYSVYSQLQRNGNNTSSIPGRGRLLSVNYQLTW